MPPHKNFGKNFYLNYFIIIKVKPAHYFKKIKIYYSFILGRGTSLDSSVTYIRDSTEKFEGLIN